MRTQAGISALVLNGSSIRVEAFQQSNDCLTALARNCDQRRFVFLIMAWFYLVIAGLFETGWAVSMKYTDGFSRFWPSLLTIVLMIISFVLLSVALKHLPLGTAYAAWTGIGAVGTALVGMLYLGEPREVARMLCIVLIVAGVVGLKLSTRSTS